MVSSSSTGLGCLGSRRGAERSRLGRSCLSRLSGRSSSGIDARSWSAIAAFKLKPIRLPFGSRFMTFTSNSSPTETTSSGLSIRRSAISEIWISPSIPSSSFVKAPKLVKLTICPRTTEPILYFSGTSSQGSGWVCLNPNETRRSEASICSTTTSTSSPSFNISCGLDPRSVHERSEVWISPSMPSSISTNAPKFVRLRIRPKILVPTGYFCSKSSHGFCCNCLIPKEIRLSSLEISRTIASILSPLLTIRDGATLRRVHAISETWINPSTASSSWTKTP